MNRQLIMQQIVEIIKDIKKDDEILDSENDCTASFSSQGIELDSLDTLNVLIRIEKKFNVDVSQAPLSRENFKSVTTIAEFVQDLIKNKIVLYP